jgi:hypothetical protein
MSSRNPNGFRDILLFMPQFIRSVKISFNVLESEHLGAWLEEDCTLSQ